MFSTYSQKLDHIRVIICGVAFGVFERSTHLPDPLCDWDPFHMRHQAGDDEEEGEELDEAVVKRGAVAVRDVHQLLELAHGRAGAEVELHKPTKRVVVLTCSNGNCFPFFAILSELLSMQLYSTVCIVRTAICKYKSENLNGSTLLCVSIQLLTPLFWLEWVATDVIGRGAPVLNEHVFGVERLPGPRDVDVVQY